jgi:hypothetical protein
MPDPHYITAANANALAIPALLPSEIPSDLFSVDSGNAGKEPTRAAYWPVRVMLSAGD